MIAQRTLEHAIRCSGIGLHSGKKVDLVLKPAPVDSGITLFNTAVAPDVAIPAHADYVVDTRLCTTLGLGDVRIGTVEHLLSALVGMGVDNADVEVGGSEVPVMDGSAAPFVFLIQCAGIKEQSKSRQVMKILKKITVKDGDKICSISPANTFKVSYALDYNHPLLRQRKVCIDFSTQAYSREISRARTFGFMHEIEALQKAGLALGGSLENAVVLDATRVMNENGLRYRDECARHKILDTVGDLFLSGYPMLGAFEGEKTGHAMNYALVKAVLEDPEAWHLESMNHVLSTNSDTDYDQVFAAT
ncbi:MAG: UDP-3-O-acyl-N-acetylglucosamine deacetylase [Mariprofundaceae bacterium]|nr:UDP-3-O-acyl-N-acetylglucosamine deacetylase [Mariprofundaceae bacterium]